MKSFAKFIGAAFIVMVCASLGFGVAQWLATPTLFTPLFLMPAAFVFSWFNQSKFDWVKTTLFLLLLGASIWSVRALVPAPEGVNFAFIGPVVLIVFLPRLERIYDRLRERKLHNETV